MDYCKGHESGYFLVYFRMQLEVSIMSFSDHVYYDNAYRVSCAPQSFDGIEVTDLSLLRPDARSPGLLGQRLSFSQYSALLPCVPRPP
eukprot:m.122647 g.122647  ORF g.122647 m.122647 type:complete len:88 (-) comp19671_c3_seq2:67-330(-)